jgi:uncharacterized protein
VSGPLLSVVLHDVAGATWPACERVLGHVRSLGPVPVTLLAVPRYHRQRAGAPFEAWLDRARERGDELALHGYTHWDDGRPRGLLDFARRRWYTAGEGEFSALASDEARARLRAGMRWFQRNGWPLHGFVAPAWLMSPGTWEALRELHFEYTCTLAHLFSLPEGGSLHSPALVYSTRARWRRTLSLPWNAALAHAVRGKPLMRLELHPHDADHPQVLGSWMGLLGRALAERQAVTLHDAARRLLSPQAQAIKASDTVNAPIKPPASTSLG